MDQEKNKKNIELAYDYLSHAASLSDCTGLIPALAVNEAEREAYEAIHHFLPPMLDDEHESYY